MNLLRNFCVLLVVAAATLAAAAPVAAQQTLDFGKKFEGELGGDIKIIFDILRSDGYVDSEGIDIRARMGGGYHTFLPIKCKAGQNLTVKASVLGKGRKVAVVLFDPKKQSLGWSPFSVQTAELKVEEVSATGVYTILVFSDRIGSFNLLATIPSSDEPDREALEKKLAGLRRQLDEVKRQIAETEQQLQSTLKRSIIEKQR